MSPEDMKKVLDYMDTEEFKREAEESFKEEIKKSEIKRKKNLKFFESKEFIDIFKRFEKANEEVISGDHWMYGGTYDFLSKEEFYSFFDSVTAKIDPIEELGNFSDEATYYKGLKFVVMNGQGTVYLITKTEDFKKNLLSQKITNF